MKAIINTKLILEDSIIFDGAITFEDGVILQLGKRSEVQIPEGAEVIDAGGKYTAPGLSVPLNPQTALIVVGSISIVSDP